MYYTHTREDMVRIPPDRLGENLEKVTMELARQAFEGRMGPDQKLIVLITSLKLNGDSRVVHGDGAVYQPVRIKMLLFDIRIQEVIEGLDVDPIFSIPFQYQPGFAGGNLQCWRFTVVVKIPVNWGTIPVAGIH